VMVPLVVFWQSTEAPSIGSLVLSSITFPLM